MNNEDLIDEWDNEDYEVFNQWDEEAKNKRLEELEKYFESDMEIRKGLIDRIKRQEKEIERLNKEIKNLEKHRDIMIKEYDDELKKYDDIVREAIDYVEHISNVDIDWHEQDRITNILKRVYKDE